MNLFSQGVQFILSLIFVVGLIFAAAAVARRFGVARRIGRGGGRRLAVVEFMPLDARRRLVLVRRDDVEHLILLGATSEAVVETGIRTSSPRFADLLEKPQPANPDAALTETVR